MKGGISVYFHRSHSWPSQNKCQEGCKFSFLCFVWYFQVSETCTIIKWFIYLSSEVLRLLSVYYQVERQKIRPNLQKWAPVWQCGAAADHKHSQHLQNETLMLKHWHSLCDVKWVSLLSVKAGIHKQNAKMAFITRSGRWEKGDSKKKCN